MAKVQIAPGADSLPYQVGLYHFKANAGLWFLAGCESEEQAEELEVLIEGLSYSGIGGKTSATTTIMISMMTKPISSIGTEDSSRVSLF